MSLSLLLQQSPAYRVCLILIVFMMGGRWLKKNIDLIQRKNIAIQQILFWPGFGDLFVSQNTRKFCLFYHSKFSNCYLHLFIIFTCWLMCSPAFFRCFLLNSRAYMGFWMMSFISSTGVTCSDFINHYQVQVLSIPVVRIEPATFRWLSLRRLGNQHL